MKITDDWRYTGSTRPIYIITGAYPRQVREDRGFTWSKANLENLPQRKVLYSLCSVWTTLYYYAL